MTTLDKIPAHVKAEALRAFRNPLRAWSHVNVCYDADEREFFVGPFLYRSWTEDNQITVATVQHGQLVAIA